MHSLRRKLLFPRWHANSCTACSSGQLPVSLCNSPSPTARFIPLILFRTNQGTAKCNCPQELIPDGSDYVACPAEQISERALHVSSAQGALVPLDGIECDTCPENYRANPVRPIPSLFLSEEGPRLIYDMENIAHREIQSAKSAAMQANTSIRKPPVKPARKDTFSKPGSTGCEPCSEGHYSDLVRFYSTLRIAL